MAVQKQSQKVAEERGTEPVVAPSRRAEHADGAADRPAAGPRGDLFARILGLLIILLGLAVILGVVWLGLDMYRSPTLGLGPAATKPTTNAADIGANFMRLVVRIGLLFLGSICGSLIANKGIHLFFSSFPTGSHSRK